MESRGYQVVVYKAPIRNIGGVTVLYCKAKHFNLEAL